VAPRKEHGAQTSGITPPTKESDLKYLKKLPKEKGRKKTWYRQM
jgi:hypothetical protein